MNYPTQDHTAANHKGRTPSLNNPVTSSIYLFAYSPANPWAVHTAQRAEADSRDGPALTKLTACWGTSYKHPKGDNRGSVGCWPGEEAGGPSESDLLFPLLTHRTAPLDTAMAVSPQSC